MYVKENYQKCYKFCLYELILVMELKEVIDEFLLVVWEFGININEVFFLSIGMFNVEYKRENQMLSILQMY